MKQQLRDPAAGLTSVQAREQLAKFGPNVLGGRRRLAPIAIFLVQFKSAIVLILIAAEISRPASERAGKGETTFAH